MALLRQHYPVSISRSNRRCSLALAGPLLLAGCSLSVPMGAEDAPATTGSVATPVQVQQPLPQTLAYSDATKIGQAAVSALSQVDKAGGGEWINNATGSSGTVEPGVENAAAKSSEACSNFATTVTSIGGVHRYSGKICKSGNGRPVVEIAAPAEAPQA